MPQCCFAGCHNRTDDGKGLSFFRFPRRDPTRFDSWIKACGRINFQPSEHSRICSNHFSTEDFERDFRSELLANAPRRLRLRDNAIPTSNPIKTPWPELDKEAFGNIKSANNLSMDRKRQLHTRPENETLKRRVTDADVLDLSKKPDTVQDASGQGPIDLSRKEDSGSGKGDMDIICLSDDDEEELAKIEAEFASKESDTSQASKSARLFLRKLANDLRNEEARLLLLHKMKASQAQLQSGAVVGQARSGGIGAVNRPTTALPARNNHSGQPQQNQINRLSRPQGGQPTPAHGHVVQSTSQNNRIVGQQQSNRPADSSSISSVTNNVAPVSQPPAVRVTRTMALHVLEQRMTAKKTLLRKETEKALLEISSPCPNQTELSFIPSIATNEFVALVGMEEVVKSIQENDKILRGGKVKDISYTITPFSCVQCGTDFTPLWKRDRSGGSNVICEACLCSSQRSSVQKEYIDKIKQVVKKATQQEKTLEKEYKDVANNPTELSKFQREQERQLQAQQPRPAPQQQSSSNQLPQQHRSQVLSNSNHPQQRSSLTASSAGNTTSQSRPNSSGFSSQMRSAGSTLVQQSALSKSSLSTSGSRGSLSSAGGGGVQQQQRGGQSPAGGQQSSSARNASLAAVAQAQAQAQALMNLNLFPQGLTGAQGIPSDFRQQQYMQQALLQQLALLQSQPTTYAHALSGLSNGPNYLTMLQNWAAGSAAAANTSQLGGGGSKQGKK